MIRKYRPIMDKFRGYPLTPAFSPNTSHLEDIDEIGIKFD